MIIADAEDNEDVVIKVSDEGGGIKRSHMPRIWSYLFTTAKVRDAAHAAVHSSATHAAVHSDHGKLVLAQPAFDATSSLGDHTTDSPLAGLGYGLPISRSYARYFGGDLNIMSMEGYGEHAQAQIALRSQVPRCDRPRGVAGTDAFLHLNKLGNRSEPLP